MLTTLLRVTALLALAGCGLPHRPEITSALGAIDGARLRQHVEDLSTLGPRPYEDAEATEVTVAYLVASLGDLGLTAIEEPVSLRPQRGRFFAKLRASDAAADSEPIELELPAHRGNYGRRVIQAQTDVLRSEGWQVEGYVLREAHVGEVVVPNLIVDFPGTSGRPGILEITAHYDTVSGSPGADDNASGVAALLEIARVLTDHPPERSVRLVFFAAEEAGLLGSAEHVRRIQERGDDVQAVLDLDCIGVASDEPDTQQAPVRILFVTWMPSTGDFVTVVGNWSSGPLGNLYEAAIDRYVPELAYYSANRIGGFFADGHRSDHANYWKAGIPALLLTDTGEFRDEHYHRPGDLPETLDYDFLRQVTAATLATALEWARH